MVLDRDAEQLSDHDRRERLGDVVDQVEGALGLRFVGELADERLDVVAQRGDAFGGEGLVDKLADARVVGRVHDQHRAHASRALAQELRHAVEVVAHERRAHALDREARVAQHRVDVAVAREHPHAGAGVVRGDRHLEHGPHGAGVTRWNRVRIIERVGAAQRQEQVEVAGTVRRRVG